MHKSGNRYSWRDATQNLKPPILPTPWLDFLVAAQTVTQTAQTVTQTAQTTQTTQDNTGQRKTLCRGVVASVDPHITAFVDDCIGKTLPPHPGKRHDSVFRLARYLRGNPEVAAWGPRQLRPIVNRWHALAVERLGKDAINADADTNWFDFSEGWGKVQYPGEDGIMAALMKRATETTLPAVANEYQTKELRLLIGLCCVLQHHVGDKPFYLATTSVDRLLGLRGDRMRAWRWLQGLVRDGVLVEVEKGDPKKRQAASYRYIGGE
jgi:hypothetical protein